MMLEQITSEDQIYDAILGRMTSAAPGDDLWEIQSYVELMKLSKNGQEPNNYAVRNGILLLLSIFNSEREGIELWGTDIHEIDPQERKYYLDQLGEALPTSNLTL